MNPIGTKTIETYRLILRQWRLEDATAMFQNWASDVENTQSSLGKLTNLWQ